MSELLSPDRHQCREIASAAYILQVFLMLIFEHMHNIVEPEQLKCENRQHSTDYYY